MACCAIGLNFVPALTRLLLVDTIGRCQAATGWRHEQPTNGILRCVKLPKDKLTTEQRKALKELRTQEDEVILPADKGNTTVVMTRMLWHQVNRDAGDYHLQTTEGGLRALNLSAAGDGYLIRKVGKGKVTVIHQRWVDGVVGTVLVQTLSMWRWTIFPSANSTSKDTGPLGHTMTAATHWGVAVSKAQTNPLIAKQCPWLELSWSRFCQDWDFPIWADRSGHIKLRWVFNCLPINSCAGDNPMVLCGLLR